MFDAGIYIYSLCLALVLCPMYRTVLLQVLMTSLAVEQVSYKEAANMWIGPRQVGLYCEDACRVCLSIKKIRAKGMMNMHRESEKKGRQERRESRGRPVYLSWGGAKGPPLLI